MIDFIFIIMLIIYLFLLLAIWKEEYIIGMITAMGMIVTGIYLAIYGAGDVSNILTQTLGLVNMALGVYIFLRGTVEKTQEVM